MCDEGNGFIMRMARGSRITKLSNEIEDNMSYEFFIAKRYLRSKRKTSFISVITIFSTGGILIGVAALIITFAIMNGFESEVRTRIIGFDAHIRLR